MSKIGLKSLTAAGVLLLVSAASATAADLAVSPRMPMKALPMMPLSANPILYVNNQLSLDAIGQHFDDLQTGRMNTATDPIGPTVGEKGWLPGIQFTGSAMGNLGALTNVYVMGQFTWAKGDTTYTGSLCVPYLGKVTCGPYGSNVHTDHGDTKDFDFRLGKGFEVGPNWMFTPYFGAGYHGYDNFLPGKYGYNEKVDHGYAGGGLLIQWAPTNQWVLSANGLVGSTFSAKYTISQTPGGAVFPMGTNTLGSKVMWKAGLSSDYALTPQWHLNAGIDYTEFNYGLSSAANAAVTQRTSRTDIWTAKAGFGYSFYQPASRY